MHSPGISAVLMHGFHPWSAKGDQRSECCASNGREKKKNQIQAVDYFTQSSAGINKYSLIRAVKHLLVVVGAWA